MGLKVKLLPGWRAMDNPDGPLTCVREVSKTSGAFQISHAEYIEGEVPSATEESLLGMSRDFGSKRNWGQPTEIAHGPCDFGVFGAAAFQAPDDTFYRIWWVSNGRDFLMATHTAMSKPESAEITEAHQIALMLSVG